MAQHHSDAPLKRLATCGPVWRVMQFAAAAAPRGCGDVDRRLRGLVENDAQWALLARMPAFDRAHHLRVHDSLLAAGHDDPDLLLAALLHDTGKVDERGRVMLVHRVTKVLLGAISPAMLERAAGWNNRFGHGLYLACNHAALGAIQAGQAGASARCCTFIARHHAPDSDPLLSALIEADEGALA